MIDASALAAVVFDEAPAVRVQAMLGGAELVAPSPLPYGMANVCVTKSRRTPAERDALLRALELARRIEVRLLVVSGPGVTALAQDARLSACVAAYLRLARHLGAPLVTLVEGLAAAAG